MIERVWEWRFAAPPDVLWPVLADTARFNEAVGLPRYAVSETPQPDGTVRRIGNARKFGVALSWEESVPEWVAPRLFRHERRFPAGPLRLVRTEITIDSDGGKGSLVRYRLWLSARFALLEPLLRLAVLPRFGRTLDRLFTEAAASAISEAEPGFRPPPPELPAAIRDRVTARARAVAQQGYGAVDRLARHLLDASDSDLERMRPRVLARQWRAEPREVIETCLAAAREGLLTLRWDLICPRCRGAKAVARSLDELPRGAHCPSCNIPFDRDFSRNVEVTFDPADDIRPPAAGTFKPDRRRPHQGTAAARGRGGRSDRGRSGRWRLPRPHRRAGRRRGFRGRERRTAGDCAGRGRSGIRPGGAPRRGAGA